MLIDFTKLHDLIPEGGCVALTVKRNKDGKLGVVFKTTHNLVATQTSYDKELKGDLEGVEKAKKDLDKTLGFSGTPEDLTSTFEEQIKAPAAAERALADAINERTKELNERIAALKNKKVGPTKTASTAKPEAKKEEQKTPPAKTKEADLGLFSGSVGGAASGDGSSCSGISSEKPEESEEEGAEEGELVGEVTA